MPSNEDRSRREILQTGAQITAGGILTGLAGCQDSEGTNNQDKNNSDGNQQNNNEGEDTPRDADESLDVSYREFANKAFIDPEVMLTEVIDEDDKWSRKGYRSVQGFSILNVVSMMDQLSQENARYLNENVREDIPWSVFNAEFSDMSIIGSDDGDGTETALLDFSMDEALEGLESRDDIDIVESSNDYIEFKGEHSTWLVNQLGEEPLYVHGYVVPTDLGAMTTVTNGVAYAHPIVDGNNGIRDIAQRHLELIDEGGKSLLDKDTEDAEMAEYVLNRAEGTSEEQPASETVELWYLNDSEGDDSLESQHAYQEDGYEKLGFRVVEDGNGYDSTEVEGQTNFVPIDEHHYLKADSQQNR